MTKLKSNSGSELTLAPTRPVPRLSTTTELRAEADALRARVEQLERLNAELDRFVAVAAHDLSEPLRVVAGYASLLLEGTAGPISPAQRDFIGRMDSAVGRMQDLIDDLRRYSQVDALIERDEVDLGDVVAEALENLREMLRERGAEVSVETEMPVVSGDHVQLVQLMQNLIGNAIKFGPPAHGLIEIFAKRRNHGWQISVRDHGRGIAAEDQIRIFEPFRRLRGTGHIPGSGLGLAICRRIVSAHGGKISVQSEVGAGATFRFLLPDAPLPAGGDMADSVA